MSDPDHFDHHKFLREVVGLDAPAALPCRCGAAPELEVRRAGSGLVALRLVHVKWWGLLTCHSGPWVYDDADQIEPYGRAVATHAWNNARRLGV